MNDDPPDLEELERLGRVDPPPPDVLDTARQVLWSAVAAEMLATAPDAAYTSSAQADAGHLDAVPNPQPDAPHPGGEPAATGKAGEPAREPSRADPGAS